MLVDHDRNVLYDSYIIEFIYDSTENYYERGTYAYRYLNNINFPLFMLKVLKLFLFHLPMLLTMCFIDLVGYKVPMHRKWVRLKCVLYLFFDALLCFKYYSLVSIFYNPSCLAQRHKRKR